MNYNTLTLESPLLPTLVKHIAQPPKKLFYIGNSLGELTAKPRVAIVGARAMSPYGRRVTETFATGLAEQGIVIVSGLAIGVDACALRAALQAGGKCIAVLPSPLDNIVPTSNRNLARAIVDQGGVLISEYEPGATLYKGNFVERNRLMSGLSDAVLITEAAAKSGSLHTADFANEQGVLTLAVPGNITSSMSDGTNKLLRDSLAGAVTCVQDVIDALELEVEVQLPLIVHGRNPQEQTVLDLIHAGVQESAELLEQSRLGPIVFGQTLMMLEIHGKVRSIGGERWALA